MNLEPAPNSPERRAAEISALVARLDSPDATKVQAALALLLEHGEAGIEALLDALTAQEKRRKRHTRNAFLTLFVWLSFVLAVGFTSGNFGLLIGSGGVLGGLFAASRAVQSQKHGAKLLARLDDVRAVGVLTDALQWNDPQVSSEARVALTRLLPRLHESDARVLLPSRRVRLLEQFGRSGSDRNLLFAILKAMEQVGGAEAIPMVSRVASGKSPSNQYAGMAERARACLSYLEARATENALRGTLLRPSEAGTVAPETLLRPAPATTEEPANELLRPLE